jgi:hypothetical protein
MASSSNITNKVITNLGTTEEVLVTTSSTQKAACVGLSLANITEEIVTASIFIEDADENKGYFIKNLRIAPQSAARVINGGEKLLLAPENTVSIVCDTANGLDVVFSLVVITYT